MRCVYEGIDDPAAARKAMTTVRGLTDKQLVDAGEVERVKAEAIRAIEEKYAPVTPDGSEPYQALGDEEIVLRILGLIGPAALGGPLPETAGREAGGAEEAGAE